MTPAPNALSPLPQHLIDEAVIGALAEDLGTLGDVTSNSTIPAESEATTQITTRAPGVISGLDVAETAFHAVDPSLKFDTSVQDGDQVKAGTVVATISGKTRGILTAERVALNFLGRMSGIATFTNAYVKAIEGCKAQIVDTRKTTPGLRAFEKYAVRCGGGSNHRVGLYDAILIKDNHIAAAGGVGEAVKAARAASGHMLKIEVEVDTLAQLDELLTYDADAVLLDNMSPADLKLAVKKIEGRLISEASGGVSLNTVRPIAESGVDLISVGALTHSAPVLDLGLDFVS